MDEKSLGAPGASKRTFGAPPEIWRRRGQRTRGPRDPREGGLMFRRLLPYLRPVWFRFAVALVCMSGVAAISTGFMALIKYLNDHALVDKDMDALHSGVVLVLVGIGLKSILWYTHTYLTS